MKLHFTEAGRVAGVSLFSAATDRATYVVVECDGNWSASRREVASKSLTKMIGDCLPTKEAAISLCEDIAEDNLETERKISDGKGYRD